MLSSVQWLQVQWPPILLSCEHINPAPIVTMHSTQGFTKSRFAHSLITGNFWHITSFEVTDGLMFVPMIFIHVLMCIVPAYDRCMQ
jgi:hypothetical protein